MQSFLQLVAHDLYAKIGNDLSRTALIFPNKRANLFFNEYLAGESDQPIWSPTAMSISDLFQKLSVQKGGDPIRLVCELYKVFKEETQSQETLDDFYFWGELLISDFDDVDKNMVDADKLFSNLQDLKKLMDDYEFLDKEQEEAIQSMNFAWEMARPDSFWEPFIEYHGLLQGLLEVCVRKKEPEIYKQLVGKVIAFSRGWMKIHNPKMQKAVTDLLSPLEFSIAMLACRNWTNQEIAEYLGFSMNTVKHYVSGILEKLGIDKRDKIKNFVNQ